MGDPGIQPQCTGDGVRTRVGPYHRGERVQMEGRVWESLRRNPRGSLGCRENSAGSHG